MRKSLKPDRATHQLRSALGQFPTGVAIVTAIDNHRPIGMTINSFCSVSLTPALVSWCIDRRSANYLAFSSAATFAISVLADDQVELAKRFATRGADKFNDIRVENDEAPVIAGAAAWFKCAAYRQIPLGDHRVLIGKVLSFDKRQKNPMVFGQGRFQRLIRNTDYCSRIAA